MRGSNGSGIRHRELFEGRVGRSDQGSEGGVGSKIGRYWDTLGGTWARNWVEWLEESSFRYRV
jgi:hypothetical protein